jgi:hypothetical protein
MLVPGFAAGSTAAYVRLSRWSQWAWPFARTRRRLWRACYYRNACAREGQWEGDLTLGRNAAGRAESRKSAAVADLSFMPPSACHRFEAFVRYPMRLTSVPARVVPALAAILTIATTTSSQNLATGRITGVADSQGFPIPGVRGSPERISRRWSFGHCRRCETDGDGSGRLLHLRRP